jgi:hypothetical protein
MKIVILVFLSLILQDNQKSNTEQTGKPRSSVSAEKPDGGGLADDRDPEDVKYEHELWKRIQGKYWRAETDPSTWPKFMRARTTQSYPERKNLWQVESVYTIRDDDSCKHLASEMVSAYGGALERAYLTVDEPICYFFVTIGPTSAETMSHDKRIRRVREVDDTWPPPSRSVRPLIQLQLRPFGKSPSELEAKPKSK